MTFPTPDGLGVRTSFGMAVGKMTRRNLGDGTQGRRGCCGVSHATPAKVWTTGRRRKGGVKGKKGERGEDRRKRQERGNAEKGVAKGGRERRESPGSARAQRRPDSRRHSSAALEAHSSSSTAKPARTMPLPKIGRPDARGWSSFMPHPASAHHLPGRTRGRWLGGCSASRCHVVA